MAIYAPLEELLRYKSFKSDFAAGLDYLAGLKVNMFQKKPVGFSERVEIKGCDIFALNSVYKPKPASKAMFESHKQYIDLQMVLHGEEKILISCAKSPVAVPYDRAKDITFYKPGPSAVLLMRPKMVAVFYPYDLHAPSLRAGCPALVIKSVVKIKIE